MLGWSCIFFLKFLNVNMLYMFDFEFFLGGFVFHFEFAGLAVVFVFCFIDFFF